MEGLVWGIRRREWIFSHLSFLSSSIAFQMDKNTRYLTSDITNTQWTDHGKYHPEQTKAWTYRHHKGDALSHQCWTAAKRHLIESVPSKELHPVKIAHKSPEVGSSEEALQIERGRGMGNPPGVGVGVLWGLGRGCFFDTLAVPLTTPPVPQVPLSIPWPNMNVRYVSTMYTSSS